MQVSEHGVRSTRRHHTSGSLTPVYEPHVAEQIDENRRYAVLRAGRADYAYTDYEALTRAMAQVWAAGLVPEPAPTTLGSDLPTVAPNLQGVDLDLSDLRAAEVRPKPSRFERPRRHV
jgi:hypothetical protein